MNSENLKLFLEFFKTQRDTFDWIDPSKCILGMMSKFTKLYTRSELAEFFGIDGSHLSCMYWMLIEGLKDSDLTHENAIQFLEDYIDGKYQYDPVQSFLVKNK